MTRNQLTYWANQETKRNNLAKEGETYRSNVAQETENRRSHMVNERNQYMDALTKRMAHEENVRHNRESEKVATANAITGGIGAMGRGVGSLLGSIL